MCVSADGKGEKFSCVQNACMLGVFFNFNLAKQAHICTLKEITIIIFIFYSVEDVCLLGGLS
jgi:hypothetical protein